MTGWRALHNELEHWASARRTLDLWWRDDDARTPGPSLDRLLSMARLAAAPVTLAVIPDGDRRDLAARLAFEPLVTVIQHGVHHVNVNRFGPAAEFPLGCPRDAMQMQLTQARARLASIPRLAPIFSPPWNAVHPQLVHCLAAEGYRGLSALGETISAETGFTRIDVHLDLLRWRGGPRFVGADAFLKAFARLARARRRSGQWDQPIGLLTHHLVHDEAAWRFLGELLDLAAGHPALGWRRIEDLLAPAPEQPARIGLQQGLLSYG